MSRNLGKSPGPQPLAATRVSRAGWRDPRLWIGLLLLTVSVVAGARLLAAADDTQPVWAMVADVGTGTAIDADDVEIRHVRFATGAAADLYFSASEPMPEGLVLARSVGAGELLPRSAVAAAEDATLLQVPLEVDPNRVPGSVTVGSTVDVFVDDRAGRSSGQGRALSAVTVVDAPAYDDTFAISGVRQIVVAVPEADVEPFEALLADMDDPVLRIAQRS